MRRRFLFFATFATGILYLSSCLKQEDVQPQDIYPVFSAIIDNTLTKTTIDTDPTSESAGAVCWELTDSIKVMDNDGNTAVYRVRSISGERAVFEYQTGAVLGVGPYTAAYGSSPQTTQTYSPTAGKLPMTASSETTEFAFTVTCGLLKLTLTGYGENISRVEVTGTPADGTETTYTLICDPAQNISSAMDFYISLPAGSYDRYVFYDSEGKVCTKTAKAGKSTVIKPNTIQPVTFSSSLSFECRQVDLSSSGAANCYIVSEAGNYRFRAVKGNTDIPVADIKGVKVLWESFGTEVVPSVGDLIKPDVTFNDGTVTFSTNDSYTEGNAVIAAYSDVDCTDGNVLWSWHIWLTDTPLGQEYSNDAGTMMDRNLGATSAIPGDVHALGLLYQWGRKDPFIGNVSVTSDSPYGTSAASTIEWPHSSYSNSSKGTIEYSVAYPTKFITADTTATTNNDWYYTGSSETDDTRWQTSDKAKTMYDPCPTGWRVPDGGDCSIWSKAFGSSAEFTKGPWDSTNRGMNFGSGNGKDSSMQLGAAETIWYPATGCRSYKVSGIKWPGSNGYYWTCSPVGSGACSFFFDLTGKVVVSSDRERAAARSVRCIRE